MAAVASLKATQGGPGRTGKHVVCSTDMATLLLTHLIGGLPGRRAVPPNAHSFLRPRRALAPPGRVRCLFWGTGLTQTQRHGERNATHFAHATSRVHAASRAY